MHSEEISGSVIGIFTFLHLRFFADVPFLSFMPDVIRDSLTSVVVAVLITTISYFFRKYLERKFPNGWSR